MAGTCGGTINIVTATSEYYKGYTIYYPEDPNNTRQYWHPGYYSIDKSSGCFRELAWLKNYIDLNPL